MKNHYKFKVKYFRPLPQSEYVLYGRPLNSICLLNLVCLDMLCLLCKMKNENRFKTSYTIESLKWVFLENAFSYWSIAVVFVAKTLSIWITYFWCLHIFNAKITQTIFLFFHNLLNFCSFSELILLINRRVFGNMGEEISFHDMFYLTGCVARCTDKSTISFTYLFPHWKTLIFKFWLPLSTAIFF